MNPLQKYKEPFEIALINSIDSLGPKSLLIEASRYSLINEGKRVRPIIVLSIADHLSSIHRAMPAALAVEYFHTASLIADDMPCMDNDDFRRNRLSLHKEFGEAEALLTSYGLITAAFHKIHENAQLIEDRGPRFALAIELASKSAGFFGATTGQYWDLFEKDLNLQVVEKIFYHKTGTLFEVSFVFGWIFGGGDLKQIDSIRELAYTYGLAFQIADDLLDLDQDLAEKNALNIAIQLGKDRAFEIMNAHLSRYFLLLDELGLTNDALKFLADTLIARVSHVRIPAHM
ncbi:MAG: polyprenyl synthetase family protein [Simkaniaceae bacterium]|nr:polyprenyl synthetase family protein [Simkaniaceae bacterium]